MASLAGKCQFSKLLLNISGHRPSNICQEMSCLYQKTHFWLKSGRRGAEVVAQTCQWCMWKNAVFSHLSKLGTCEGLVHNVHSFELHKLFLANHVTG